MEKIIIASNNAGKLREFRAILEPFGLEVVSQREAGFCQDVEETGTTFAENAAIKAKAVYAAMHCPVIADDSGLIDRKSTRLNSSHTQKSRMPSSA